MRLGRARLGRLRKAGHNYFDILWLHKHYHCGKTAAFWRRRTYKWLAGRMEIKPTSCHFKMFDEQQCKQAIDICSDEFESRPKLYEFADAVEDRNIFHLTWFKT